jgi:hypothetical protein
MWSFDSSPPVGLECPNRWIDASSGELKARARTAFDRRRWLTGGNDIGYDESVDILARCWSAILAENSRKAWNVA